MKLYRLLIVSFDFYILDFIEVKNGKMPGTSAVYVLIRFLLILRLKLFFGGGGSPLLVGKLILDLVTNWASIFGPHLSEHITFPSPRRSLYFHICHKIKHDL